ncbi:MAG: hypothetical protein MJZ12_08430 [Prevotella sp.]|nr:hypothetical protein [Prevotella sp.]
MKKIIFSLMALMCTLSINAQLIKVMKGNEVVATYTAAEADNVVFEEVPTTGTAKATINGSEVDVKWVQLWAGGPKFAEYNVGVTDGKAESYGGYYCWGSSIEKDPSSRNTDNDPLTGTYDTATNLWGNKWRMPTKGEIEALPAKCNSEWTEVNGIKGRKITGKGDYASNSIFLPAAGYYTSTSGVVGEESIGYFWSSTPFGSYEACSLHAGSGSYNDPRSEGHSVRAVLKEN